MKAYLKDNSIFLLLFLIQTTVIMLTTFLIIHEAGLTISFSDLFYLFILSVFFMLTWLAIDWFRRRYMLKRLTKAGQTPSIERTTAEELIEMRTHSTEARLWQNIIKKQHLTYQHAISQQELDREQHTEFVNQWVHHMKTPVSVISLMIQQEKETGQNHATDSFLDDLNEENERFRRGLDLMLQLARLDHFSVDLKSESINLGDLIHKVINEEKKQFIRRKIYPKVVLKSEAPIIVTSDSKWLHVLINQLLLNALKYSKQQKGAFLYFDLSTQSGQTTLKVIDEGIGIQPYDIPRIFHPFFTGDHGRTHAESTGMGLYLVKQICEKLGHRIEVESRVGLGSTFTLTFKTTTLHDNFVR
ncbi:sensor histidine kinase [Alkalicoccobacillus gibsonii]|uniref:histidine kinase n=1 Tax=Alkalicoccobacillus gibsonii TaxID=79881 RepID=A0ABU9VFP5_9BACI